MVRLDTLDLPPSDGPFSGSRWRRPAWTGWTECRNAWAIRLLDLAATPDLPLRQPFAALLMPSNENVVSLLEWLIARARRRGEPLDPILRRLVLGTLEEVQEGLARGAGS